MSQDEQYVVPAAPRGDQVAAEFEATKPMVWTGADVNLMHRTIAPDLNEDEFRLFGRLCSAMQLNPFAGDVFPVIYNKKKPSARKMVLIQSIDAMRRRGLASGLVAEIKGPEWAGPDGEWKELWTSDENPFAARYGMRRVGMDSLNWNVVRWDAIAKHATRWDDGAKKMVTLETYTDFWQGAKGIHQLGIGAERQAWRRNCPGLLGNLYGSEELDAGGNVGGAPAVSVAQIVEARSQTLEQVEPVDEMPPETSPEPAPAGETPVAVVVDTDEPEPQVQDAPAGLDIGAVMTSLWSRMQKAEPMIYWPALERIAGWPDGAERPDGITALLVGAIGTPDELADMIMGSLKALQD